MYPRMDFRFTAQYGLYLTETNSFNYRWSANSVIGVPKVYPRYGDIQGAWASADKNADQFIQV